ncbi:hypothetical protein [Aquimarina sp. 2201CG5-10]|uniref:hypothetical protein n=1 Tax=Aquimarina callyspongiae TaxID=3098150 RepID=UPI002AB4E074|nr:hypothetical protein [Aquimarina sp. 2201CG5-10]MDY8137716.1 hypothetical protein [Aquimarina sp. 2201CG5-10]
MSSIQNDEMVADILNFFYPDTTITLHEITEDLRELAAEMYAEALEASDTMHLVPRPTYTPSFKWLMKEGVKALWRSKGGDEIYETVRTTVALKYKSSYHMGKMGI